MKKSLIALAALATVATAAQAQSSVTVYGIIDLGVTRATNVGADGKSVTGLSNGGLSTSRLGFRGTEDLGGGLKANFNLESEILADTGDQTAPAAASAATPATTQLFSRASWVGLSKDGVGAVRLGRVNRLDYDLAATYDAFGGNNIGGWVALKDANAVSSTNETTLKIGERISNAVDIKSPSIAGFTLTYQHGFGESAGRQEVSRTTSYGVQYAAGNFNAAVSYAEQNDANAVGTNQTSAYASYKFTAATITGGYVKYNVESSASSVQPYGYFVGARVPVNAKVTLLGQYAHLDNDAATSTKQKVYSLGATYAFSNRTTAYIIGARNDGNGQNIVSSSKYSTFANPNASKDAAAYSVGIRHSF
jgi:predicted porin